MKDSKTGKCGEVDNSRDDKSKLAIELKQTTGQDNNKGLVSRQGDLTPILPWDITGFIVGP